MTSNHSLNIEQLIDMKTRNGEPSLFSDKRNEHTPNEIKPKKKDKKTFQEEDKNHVMEEEENEKQESPKEKSDHEMINGVSLNNIIGKRIERMEISEEENEEEFQFEEKNKKRTRNKKLKI